MDDAQIPCRGCRIPPGGDTFGHCAHSNSKSLFERGIAVHLVMKHYMPSWLPFGYAGQWLHRSFKVHSWVLTVF